VRQKKKVKVQSRRAYYWCTRTIVVAAKCIDIPDHGDGERKVLARSNAQNVLVRELTPHLI
jgi:hypothetical protein